MTYFDALWQPLVEEAYDNASPATTRSVSVKRYDPSGRPAFQSYPLRTLTNYATVTQGTRSFYDALDRPTRVEQDSELGVLATTTDYLAGFKTRVTSPKHQGSGNFTETTYLAWDQPTTDFPTLIAHPENAVTQIVRDAFGKPTQLIRRSSIDPAQWKSHYFAYDAHQRLCKRSDVETGTNAMGYDDAGNLTWSASGLSWSPAGACLDPQAAHVIPRRVDRLYDARNRLKELSFPDGRGDQSWEYTPDGLPKKVHTVNVVGANNIDNAWDYYRRRMLKTETQLLPAWYTYSLGYTYDGNGSLQRINYPSSDYVDFAPNALGQATQAVGSGSGSGQIYASNVTYYPNGSIEKFNYGNGILHDMVQNARQLPSWVAFNNSVGHYQYGYDKNANVTSLIDLTTGQNGRTTRTMTYDGLDRLRTATSPMFPGGALYEYDTLDNLTRVKAPGRDQTYCYTNNRLDFVRNGPSCTSSPAAVALGYDNQGNVAFKNEADYDFDYGNRLREVMGVERYRYDAHGRRILAMQFNNGTIFSQYGQSGQLLYQINERTGQMKTIDHVYLAGSLIAQREVPIGGGAAVVKYQHTDALGSPVAVTNQAGAVIERFEYEPYGKGLVGGPGTVAAKDGPGYTGHVLDAATGLNYMQQRYYDPQLGVFLSVDPITAYDDPVGQFHRYRYANNNPYRFTDPDGRRALEEEVEPPPPPEPDKPEPTTLATVTVTATRPAPGPVSAPIPWGRVGGYVGRRLPGPVSLFWPSPMGASACEMPGGPPCGMLSSGLEPGYWPGDAGAEEWGRRNNVGAREGKGRFHGVKQKDKGQGGGRGRDKYGVNPDTGDVTNPQGEVVGNLNDVKSK